KSEDNGVQVTLTGSFPWNVGEGANGDTSKLGPWDASEPGNAPAPPGGGNKYFDLRLLALGQHVTVDDLASATRIEKAIQLLAEGLPPPEKGHIPSIQFAPASSWLIGTE